MSEPSWVLTETVKAIHQRQLAEHGGGTGIRDEGLLESALASPKNAYYFSTGRASIQSLAASYAYAIAKNHPFVDGNKRVAFVVCMLFMRLNRYKVVASQETLYAIFWKLAAGNISQEELTQWLNSVAEKM
jgi:death-on-curing protein